MEYHTAEKMRLQPLSAAQANLITLGLGARRKLQEFTGYSYYIILKNKQNSTIYVHSYMFGRMINEKIRKW